jgi:hypothetical protein
MKYQFLAARSWQHAMHLTDHMICPLSKKHEQHQSLLTLPIFGNGLVCSIEAIATYSVSYTLQRTDGEAMRPRYLCAAIAAGIVLPPSRLDAYGWTSFPLMVTRKPTEYMEPMLPWSEVGRLSLKPFTQTSQALECQVKSSTPTEIPHLHNRLAHQSQLGQSDLIPPFRVIRLVYNVCIQQSL